MILAFPPWAWLPYQLLWSLIWILCLIFFLLIFFFKCVRFSGLYWLFPPQAWLPCRPFWSLVWETSGRLLLTNKSLFARKDWISSTKYENTKMNIQRDTFWPMWETSGWLFLAKKESLDLERLNIFKCLTTSSYLVRRSKLKMPITFLGYPSKNKKGK